MQREEVVRAIKMMDEHGGMNMDGLTPGELADKMMAEVDTDGDGIGNNEDLLLITLLII